MYYHILLYVGIAILDIISAQSFKKSSNGTDIPHRLLPTDPSPVIKMLFVGDIMSSRGVGQSIRDHGDDPTFPYHHIRPELLDSDIKIANLEAPITNSTTAGRQTVSCKESPGGCCGTHCIFKTDDSVITGVADYAGFNLLLLQNNHIDDYVGGRNDTIKALDSRQVPWIDTDHSLSLNNYKDCNLRFFNYDLVLAVDATNAVPRMQVDLAKESNDSFVIIFVHGGVEYEDNASQVQIDFSHAAVDAGADMVVFSHPHVQLGYEIYKEKLIFWSLGNFVFDQFFNQRVSQFSIVKFDLVGCSLVTNVEEITGTINNSGQPITAGMQIKDIPL